MSASHVPAEYLADGFDTDLDDVLARHGHTLALVAQNMLPHRIRDECYPQMTYLDEWSNGFAEYHAKFTATGPRDITLANNRWHAGEGYLLELIEVTPFATDDAGQTYTGIEVRVFETARDEDPLEVLRDRPERDENDLMAYRAIQEANLSLLPDATTTILDLSYYHEEDA